MIPDGDESVVEDNEGDPVTEGETIDVSEVRGDTLCDVVATVEKLPFEVANAEDECVCNADTLLDKEIEGLADDDDDGEETTELLCNEVMDTDQDGLPV